MADCSITTTVAERTAVSAQVAERTSITAIASGRTSIDCTVAERSAVTATVSEPTVIAATVTDRDAITASVLEREAITTEVLVGVLNGWDRAKLDSVDWGATNRAPDVVKLAYASERSNSGGDSVDWVGSTTYLEIAQFLVPQPAWRANGYIEFDFTASYLNASGAGTETVTFELQKSSAWPTDVGEPAATFGLPQTWTTVSTFTSGAIAVGVGIGLFTFVFRIRANPHSGTTFRQVYGGEMLWTDLAGGDPDFRKFINRTTIDVTEDVLLRWRFKTDFTPTADVAFVVKSESAIFVCPRDGSDI